VADKDPYPDEQSARRALVHSCQYGDEVEWNRVRREVRARYPDLRLTVRKHGGDTIVTDHRGREGKRLGSVAVKVYRRREG
jgi:hypothetical protein